MKEETIPRSKIKIILLIVLGVLIIAGLVAGAYWLGTGKTKKKEEGKKTSSYPSTWTQKTNDQTEEKIENQINPVSLEYEGWNSDKEGLTLKYPKTWVKSSISDMSQVVTKEEIDKYKLSMPLIVSFPSMEKLLQIAVTRYEFSNNTIADIINTLIEESQKKVSSLTIVDQQNNDRVLVMENKYKKDNLELHTKEKIILLTAQGNTLPGYIISFSTLEKDWLEYKKVVEYVIDSAVLTDGSITNIQSGLVGQSSSVK